MEIFHEGKQPFPGASQDENFSGIAHWKIPLTRRFFSGASENENVSDFSWRRDGWKYLIMEKNGLSDR